MNFKEASGYLNQKVRFEDEHLGTSGEYTFNACILRKNAKGFFLQAELQKDNSIIIAALDRIQIVETAERTEDLL